jgi:hypothetical protein
MIEAAVESRVRRLQAANQGQQDFIAQLGSVLVASGKKEVFSARDKAKTYPAYDGEDGTKFLGWVRVLETEVMDPNWDDTKKINLLMNKLQGTASLIAQEAYEELAETWRMGVAPQYGQPAMEYVTPYKSKRYLVKQGAKFAPGYDRLVMVMTEHLLGKGAADIYREALGKIQMVGGDVRRHNIKWEGAFGDFVRAGGEMLKKTKVDLYLGSLQGTLLDALSPLPTVYEEALLAAQRKSDELKRKQQLPNRPGVSVANDKHYTRAVVRNALHLAQDRRVDGMSDDQILAAVSPAGMQLPVSADITRKTEREVKEHYEFPRSASQVLANRSLSEMYAGMKRGRGPDVVAKDADGLDDDDEDDDEELAKAGGPKRRASRRGATRGVSHVGFDSAAFPYEMGETMGRAKAMMDQITAMVTSGRQPQPPQSAPLGAPLPFPAQHGPPAAPSLAFSTQGQAPSAGVRPPLPPPQVPPPSPSGRRGAPRTAMGCYGCQVMGHNFYDCTTHCYFCKKEKRPFDHQYGSCAHFKEYVCSLCGQKGNHFMTACPLRRGPGAGSASSYPNRAGGRR